MSLPATPLLRTGDVQRDGGQRGVGPLQFDGRWCIEARALDDERQLVAGEEAEIAKGIVACQSSVERRHRDYRCAAITSPPAPGHHPTPPHSAGQIFASRQVTSRENVAPPSSSMGAGV